ncbi:hypothetical protein Syn7502_02470 [Synechococcus sp. PCC 7502]|uniref:hypothetical protein n=1 Tax=Synechococcus sp. PCC 7502 TaxID=1173263 RepID=UPI00029FD512|nr:hypothetical protein [Synechococcus sp. PCC 7502]AFY74451.1 hypothetical protein Syn7502_02470 [Synechococcus sp. PCC 7502]
MNKNIFTNLLQQFTKLLDLLSENDIQDIINGKKYFTIGSVVEKDKALAKKEINIDKVASTNLIKLEELLQKTHSRSEAEELLKNSKKTDLQKLAKVLDIPIQSRDNINKIKEKIIESTIGFKLRSQAIRNSDS